MIEFDDVNLSLGSFSLYNVSMKINKGEYFFIIGPSGAGKTILLETIAGLHLPDSGRVLIRGEDVFLKPPEKRDIALVYQDYSLFPHMTIFDNVAFGLRMAKKSRAEVKESVGRMLNHFGISHLSERKPLTMSGGEQQRVALARALVINPEILLLDEPLSAMDPVNRDRFIKDLDSIHKEFGITIVQVTHSREEAISLADRIAVIADGRLEQTGSLNEVFKTPASPVVARMAGIDNIFDGVVTDAGDDGICLIDLGGVSLKVLYSGKKGDNVNLYIHASDVLLMDSMPENGPDNILNGKIEGIFQRNNYFRVIVDCGESIYSSLSPREMAESNFKPGMEVYVAFSSANVHITGT
ncbi:ABC transporter ATP-binding protein [Methanoplanus endosymbiosus]|uniref:Molybdate/tungstate import ATP-binding protein WtpC n=1 Tax=Methanoplanus endosymbiosus TaxID=33865 RepID=A0A9E7TKU2_9EURY|nr:ATP-binding cassette domain-containing protein [Methanoplanus endosymbiosus]UUX91591.1 ATP-binding cassette domain-containing protein [Methanoplanus endosymbiosus]